jgi:hypothetical protein
MPIMARTMLLFIGESQVGESCEVKGSIFVEDESPNFVGLLILFLGSKL